MKKMFAGALVFMLAACTTTGTPEKAGHPCLQISRFPSAVVLGQYDLADTDAFSLTFVHSVSMTPVRDDYRISGTRIIQTGERFLTHGAGLPSEFGEPGVTGWEISNGHFLIRMHRPIPRLVVRTDGHYRNRLIIGGREINLNAWDDQALALDVVFCTNP